jgi:hypothetical protein
VAPDVADLRISPELAHIMYAYARWTRSPTPPSLFPFRCTHPDCRQPLVLRYEPGGQPSHFEHAEKSLECPFRVRALIAAADESITEWIPQDEWMEMARWWGRRSGGERGGGVGVGVRMPVFPRSPLSSAAHVEFDDDDCV